MLRQLQLSNQTSLLPACTMHALLLEYTTHHTTQPLTNLPVSWKKGRKNAFENWDHYGGSFSSLEHSNEAGRPCMLTPWETDQCARDLGLAANHKHQEVGYFELLL